MDGLTDESKNLLGVLAGQSSLVAILTLVLVLSIAGAPLLQQKKVIGAAASAPKSPSRRRTRLARGHPRRRRRCTLARSLQRGIHRSHFPGALDTTGARVPADSTRREGREPRYAPPRSALHAIHRPSPGRRICIYAVPDRAGGVLMLDLPLERERALIGRFFGQSYLSTSAVGYILVGLLLLRGVRLALLPAHARAAAGRGAPRHDRAGPRSAQRSRRNLLPWLLAPLRVRLRRGSRQRARFRGRHRLRARGAAQPVVEPALARDADRHRSAPCSC